MSISAFQMPNNTNLGGMNNFNTPVPNFADMFNNMNNIGQTGAGGGFNLGGMQGVDSLSMFDPSSQISGILGEDFGNNAFNVNANVNAEAGGMFDFLDSENFGKISNGIGAAQNLFSLYAGMQGLGLAKDNFKLQSGLAKTNLNNQANVTNERLRTRQGSRLRSQGITGEANEKAVAEFMAKNSVSGKVGG